MENFVFRMEDIVKDFYGVKALDGVSLRVAEGEIHAVAGENGAGKSTLMKVLSGFYPYGTYSGDIYVNEELKKFYHIKDSEEAGIAIIYQELALVPQMNVIENIFLGHEISSGTGTVHWGESLQATKELLNDLELDIAPEEKIANLGIGQQQLVEIARALQKKATILILDEPTAALNEHDTERLLSILDNLRKRGVTCIYISHKLNEILKIADELTVIRDGKKICRNVPVQNNPEMNEDFIISNMVGRTLENRFPRKERERKEEVALELRDWTVPHPQREKNLLENISLKAYSGEILGIAGLMGAGRTELAMSLLGTYGKHEGSLYIYGEEKTLRSPREAMENGLAYLSEDRKNLGLVLSLDVLKNLSLAHLRSLSRYYAVDPLLEIKTAEGYVKDLKIKISSLEQQVRNLSGGNQQKVALGKWLMIQPMILILDEPTRGIDVGAKTEIYHIMNKLVDQGVTIIMISSELPEILGMCDRILVMSEGRIAGELNRNEAEEEKIMYYATGGK